MTKDVDTTCINCGAKDGAPYLIDRVIKRLCVRCYHRLSQRHLAALHLTTKSPKYIAALVSKYRRKEKAKAPDLMLKDILTLKKYASLPSKHAADILLTAVKELCGEQAALELEEKITNKYSSVADFIYCNRTHQLDINNVFRSFKYVCFG